MVMPRMIFSARTSDEPMMWTVWPRMLAVDAPLLYLTCSAQGPYIAASCMGAMRLR